MMEAYIRKAEAMAQKPVITLPQSEQERKQFFLTLVDQAVVFGRKLNENMAGSLSDEHTVKHAGVTHALFEKKLDQLAALANQELRNAAKREQFKDLLSQLRTQSTLATYDFNSMKKSLAQLWSFFR